MSAALHRGLAGLAGLLWLSGCAQAPPPPAPLPAPPTAADAISVRPSAQITRVALGNALTSDGHVAVPMVQFSPHDTVYASLDIETPNATPHTLSIHWTHLGSRQTVLQESKPIAAAGRSVSTFQISKPDGWPLGTYKAEVGLDGTAVQTRLWDVVATP